MNSYGRGYQGYQDYDWSQFIPDYRRGQQWQQQYGQYGQLPWFRHLMGEQLQPWQPPKVGEGKYRQTIPIPSDRDWGRMAPSEQKGYWGLVPEEQWEDLAWYIQSQRPPPVGWNMPGFPRFNRYGW